MKAPFARLAFVLAFLGVCSYAFVAWQGDGGLRALAEKEAKIKDLEQRNAALAKEIERKRGRIKRLNENPAEQELEIRDRLKLVHPNEKVYVTGEPQKKPLPKQ